MNCPVCEKAGIPNYIEKNVICPQCNSDLKSFKIIHQLREENVKNNKKRKIPIILSLLGFSFLITSLFILFLSKSETKIDVLPITNNLSDSLIKLKSLNNQLLIDINKSNDIQRNEIKYILRKGDNLVKISEIFYNDPNKYEIIMEENKIINSNKLIIGDTLIINLKYFVK